MRRTLAFLAAIVLVGCTEVATQPIAPPDEVLPGVFVNEDAVRMFLRDLRTELAEPGALVLNASLAGVAPTERESAVKEQIRVLERRLADGMYASTGTCDPNATIHDAATTIVVRPPFWDDPITGDFVTVTSYIEPSGPARVGGDLTVIHGREWNGPPPTGEWEWSESICTNSCVTAYYKPSVDFLPIFRPGFVWGHTIHRLRRPDGTELTAVTDTVAFLKAKGGPRDPGLGR